MTATDHKPKPQTGPLAGLRIVEFGHFIAAPFCTRLLADLGAEVIKVEGPEGDPVRAWGAQHQGRSVWWSVHGRNKKSVTLNLKDPAARDIALALVAKSDAVVENFRPGLMERFGLAPEAMAKARPGCILARISGYGQTGPDRMMPAFGVIGEAKGGIRHLTGYPKDVTDLPPVRTGVALADSLAGLYAAFGVLAALYERRENLPGTPVRIIDVALTESVFSFLEGIIPEYGFTGAVRQPAGSYIPTAAPTNAYRSREGAWVLIAANSDPLFSRLAVAMERPDLLENPDYADNKARVAHVTALDAEIAAWTERLAAAEIFGRLEAAGIPCSKIYDIADIAADRQYRAREALRQVFDPQFGREMLHPAPMPRFDDTAPGGDIFWPGPPIGAHNEQVYGELLGLNPETLAEMKGKGVI
ncbi:MAG TPA: CaiB/BaiF CoA-transferase family protein [Thermohalobaculum sp.]|nr:CaiB/BaiF CoA-transferase family protein [Thermohalobaculum sp.]